MKKKSLKIVKKTIGVLADKQMSKIHGGDTTTDCPTKKLGIPDTGLGNESTSPFGCGTTP